MPMISMTFEKILYVKKVGGGRTLEWTEFGFVSNGKSYEGVLVPGRPHIGAGLSVTAFLRKEDDWHTLAGWINNQSGDIAAEDATYHAFDGAPFALAFCYFARQAAIAAPIERLWVVFYYSAFSLLTAICAVIALRRYLSARSALRQLKQARQI
jgi:hypothetical protein